MRTSVVIPFKNRLSTLKEAVASVGTQVVKCDELILVNDGGEAPDLSDLQKEAGQEIEYVERLESHGAACARNEGARKGTGDVLCFLDSDDKWRREHLAKGLALLSDHPEVAFLATSYGPATSTRQSHDAAGLLFIESVPAFQFGDGGSFRTSGFLIRKEAFWSVGGFDEGQDKHQDWDLAMRVWESGLVVGFNRQSTVLIDSAAEGRMSYKPNPKASLRFYNNHKEYMNRAHRWIFRKGVLKGMIKGRRLSGWGAVARMFG